MDEYKVVTGDNRTMIFKGKDALIRSHVCMGRQIRLYKKQRLFFLGLRLPLQRWKKIDPLTTTLDAGNV